MGVRDEVETVLRAWNAHEIARGHAPVIDFDCHPTSDPVEPTDRLTTYRRLHELRADATGPVAARLDADLAYLGALLGERPDFTDYISSTQGCSAAGWSDDYIAARGETARKALATLGIAWGPNTASDLTALEGPLAFDDAPDAIRAATAEYEPLVRQATGSTAPFDLTIEAAEVDAYWAFWTDGIGPKVRLRLNRPNISFTKAAARTFAMHEVLGHGLQGASYYARAAAEDVPWVRLLSVHAPQQVLLEGLAQALPLFITPGEEILTARVHMVHYTQLARAELHQAINGGAPALDCADQARARVPFWTDANIARFLSDRGTNPQLRTYHWAYPAGIDWFTHLAKTDQPTITRVLHAAYKAPLTPAALAALWPTGPSIGGNT